MNRKLQYQNYCTVCQEIVGIHPQTHRNEEHDGRPEVDVLPIEYQDADGRWIATSHGMGHFSPHVWIDVDGQDMCSECGAVRIDESVVEQATSDKSSNQG